MNGSYLYAKRNNLKLSAANLAKRVGVSWQFIRQIEKGQKQPSLDTAIKLAAALNCTLDELANDRSA